MKPNLSGKKRDGNGIKTRKKSDMVEKDFLKVLLRHEDTATDMGKSACKVAHRNNRRTANGQEYDAEIQESTSRCRAAILELAERIPKDNPPESSEDLVEKPSERSVWERRK